MISMSNLVELSALEQSLGKRIFPLHLNWDSAKGDLHEESGPPNLPNLFFAAGQDYDANVERDTGEIFVLKCDENGFYKGIWVDPSDPYGKAILSDDYETAAEIADARLQEDPDNPHFLFEKAYAISEAGRDAEAVDIYETLLSIDPNNSSAMNNLALSLHAVGRMNEAHSMHQKAAKLAPNDILIQGNLARSYLINGNMTAYTQQIERVLAMHPRNLEDRLALHNFKKDTGISSANELHAPAHDGAPHFNQH